MATFTSNVVIYGATYPGLIAARKLATMGFTTNVLEWTNHVGGLTTGGLGITDLVTGTRWGLTTRFYQYIGAHAPYSKVDGTEQTLFNPSDAIAAMNATLLDDPKVTVVKNAYLASVVKDSVSKKITSVTLQNGDVYNATIFLDCSYEGDLAAMAGITMSYGVDSAAKYRERVEGVGAGVASKPGLNLEGAVLGGYRSVDSAGSMYPWRTWPPDPSAKEGDPNLRPQGYGFRFAMTKDTTRLAWPQPAGYRASDYAWVADMIANNGGAGSPLTLRISATAVSGTGTATKYSTNGGDLMGLFTNPWPKASYAQRLAIQNKAFSFCAGVHYFAANDASVSSTYRNNLNLWGLCADEFQTDYIGAPGWPSAYYVRQARTMVGQYVMTTHDAFDNGSGTNWRFPDSVGVGGYTIDAHPHWWSPTPDLNTLTEGKLYYTGHKRYSIPLRTILPHPGQCTNLIVPVCASMSTLSMDSLRMEPTWGVVCESAGTLAGLALAGGKDIGAVPYADLNARLVADGAVLSI